MKRTATVATSLFLAVLLCGGRAAAGDDLPVPDRRPHPISYQFPGGEQEYRESPLRRFEIVFFISLPASLLFSLAGASAFSLGSRGSLRFTSPEYGYILVSSVGISLALALHDNRVVYGTGREGF